MSVLQAPPRRVPREYWLLLGREYAFVIVCLLGWGMMHLTLQQVLNGLGIADWQHEDVAQMAIFAVAALSSWFGVQAGWNALGLADVARTRQRLARQLPRAFFRARRLSGARLQKFELLAYVEGHQRLITLLNSAFLGSSVAFGPYLLANIGFPGVSASLPQTYLLVTPLVFSAATMITYLTRRAHWNWLQAQMDRVSYRSGSATPRAPISADSSSWTG